MLFEADRHLFERETDQHNSLRPESFINKNASIQTSQSKLRTNNLGELHSDLRALHDALALGESSNELGDYSQTSDLPHGYSIDLSTGLEKMKSLSLEMQTFSGVNSLHASSTKTSLLSTPVELLGSDELHGKESIVQGAENGGIKPHKQGGPFRVQMFLCTTLLLVALCQILWTQKEVIGALSAQSHFLLQNICSIFGTELGWPIEPESLKIESSSFKLVSDENFRIKLRLKNHQDYAVKTPWLELALLAADESVLARKVFSARDLELQEAIAADKDLIISFNINVDEKIAPNVVGYHLDFFYP